MNDKRSHSQRRKAETYHADLLAQFLELLVERRNLSGYLPGRPSGLADLGTVADGGDFVGTASYIVRARSPFGWLDPGVFGTLGVGGGFALGAKIARPESEVWILYGDGSVGYSLAEFDTFMRHKGPVIALVCNEASFSMGVGPTFTGFLTDFVYRDEAKVGWSLATAVLVLLPLSIFILSMGGSELKAMVDTPQAA